MAVSRLEQCLATRSDELARVQRALRAKESENQSLVARQLTLERKVQHAALWCAMFDLCMCVMAGEGPA